MNLYLLKFNNYYNRIVKRFQTIQEYDPFNLETYTGVNFNPNNGVNTEQIVNYSGTEMPDYLVVTTEDGEIISRWYVVEGQRTRAQQFRLTLYRDVIADWQNEVLTAPMFIEKATLSVNNPLIYNSESMSYNQILKNRTLLKDPTGCPWIVGYVPKNWPESESKTISGNYVNQSEANADFNATDINSWAEQYNLSFTGLTASALGYPTGNSEIQFPIIRVVWGEGRGTRANDVDWRTILSDGTYISNVINDVNHIPLNPSWPIIRRERFNEYTSNALNNAAARAQVIQNIADSIGTRSKADTDTLLALNNKTLYDGSSGLTYRINVNKKLKGKNLPLVPDTNLYAAVVSTFNWQDGSLAGVAKVSAYYSEITVSLEAVTSDYICDFPRGENRYNLTDAPYDLFCLPYGKIKVKNSDGDYIVETSADLAMSVATSVAQESGLSASQFDLQLLPYCPIRHIADSAVVNADGITEINIGTLQVTPVLQKVGDTETYVPKSLIFWATQSTFEVDLQFSIPASTSPVERKVQSECDFIRICSPNYAGIYEFNPAKNAGLSTLEVNCTYKPYNPFIHIKPSFNGLYGENYDKDSKGLICGGDFSLPRMTDQWATYELNNKNYQQIFDRGIQNQEVKHNYERIMQGVTAFTGSVQGSVTGGMIGSAGGGVGTAIGSIVGGVTSLSAGIADYFLSENLRKEAIDYAKDQFGYQLDNIKAIPNSIAKTSAFVYNNVIFPFVEEYSCTEEEKQALRDKIKYNGMSVGVIGTISDYLQPEVSYIKGKLIRLEGIADNFLVVNTIANELYKGVFI